MNSMKSTADVQNKLMLRSILLATDFSSVSDAALRYALAIARRYDAQVTVAHVIHPDTYRLVPAEAMSAVQGQARRYAEQEMTNLLVTGLLRDVPHQVRLEEGDIWPALARVIDEQGTDLVVVGTHGRTGVRKLLLGSVAEEIFRLASCPVLTVGPHAAAPPAAAPGSAPEVRLRHILYASDFTPASDRAAGYALSLAQEHQARLTLLHVVEGVTDVTPHALELMREFFLGRLARLVPEEAEAWCTPECEIAFGKPPAEILRVAEGKHADLIVLGVRRTGEFPGHLPPATAYQVACQAPCPVMTVRG